MFRRGAVVFVLGSFCAWAQSTATLRGDVKDIQGAPIANAILSLANPLTGFSREVVTGESGAFQISNIPFQSYSLTVSKTGFSPYFHQLALRSNVPQSITIELTIASQITRVEVSATDMRMLVDPTGTGTRRN